MTTQARFLLRRSNPFKFPGTKPAIDPTHPASQGLVLNRGLALVAATSNLMTDALGSTITVGSTGFTNSILSIGPAITFTAGVANRLAAANQSTATPSGATFAWICLLNTVTTSDHCPIKSSGTTVPSINTAKGGLCIFNGAAYSQSSIVPSVGVPYFMAVSLANSSIVNFLVLNLNTGQVQTAATTTASNVSFAGAFEIGGNGSGQGFGGALAAAMLSPTFLNMAQLKAWAQDPWSFWYPQTIDMGTMLKAPTATSTVLFRKTLSLYGSGVGKRQSQAA